jgi:hypothetical protein
MKYSFGVPAWLGAIRVSLVLFGIPALIAFFVVPVVGRHLELSRFAEAALFVAVLLLGAGVVLTILALSSRRAAAKKMSDDDDIVA